MPFAPDASLPGTIFQPVFVCHSHSSPFFWPLRRLAMPVAAPRGRKFDVAKPPSGSATMELRPIGSGATAQPTQVNAGGFAVASNSKTSIDSRLP